MHRQKTTIDFQRRSVFLTVFFCGLRYVKWTIAIFASVVNWVHNSNSADIICTFADEVPGLSDLLVLPIVQAFTNAATLQLKPARTSPG
jgi:hypothetical protein